MKCNTCGAIGPANKRKCEFCGSEVENSGTAGTIAGVANQVAGTQISFAKDSLNLVSELNTTPTSSFSWWAFFFPIAYLFGYGAIVNGKKVAVVMLIPVLIVSLLMYLSMRLAGIANALDYIWVLFISYLVATRTHALVVKEVNYNIGIGIGSQVLFFIASVIIMGL